MRTCRSGWRLPILGVITLALLMSTASFGKSPPDKPARGAPSSQYWEGNECATCHEAVVNSFAKTRHGRAMEFGEWGGLNCQSCHGDTAEHVATADPEKAKNPAKLPLLEKNGGCLACHANQPHTRFWTGSTHDTSNVSCLDCHSVHKAKSPEKLLRARTETELCFSCHVEQRKSLRQRSTHLFRTEWAEQRQSCGSCHNPHGTQSAKLINANSTNDLCLSCHQDKRGPHLWEHPPVKENCLVCHTAHGSNTPSLLVQRSTTLCQSCHLQGRHQTIAGRPNSMWIVNRGCLNCHPQVHGSNHPSGVNLQR